MKEAIVTEVDIIRGVCKCKLFTGGELLNVQWLTPVGSSVGRGGIHSYPEKGERVVLESIGGEYVIIGAKSQVMNENLSRPNYFQEQWVKQDTGDLSYFRDHKQNLMSSAPMDMAQGDKSISSKGGSVVGVLASGSVLVKATNLCNLFLTRIDNFARLVSDRWEHFTAIHSDYVVHKGKKAYRFLGYGLTPDDAKKDRYKYVEVIGDTSLGLELKGKYHTIATDASQTPQNESTAIKVTQVLNYEEEATEATSGYLETQHVRMEERQFLNGRKETIVKTVDEQTHSIEKQHENIYYFQTSDGTNTATAEYKTESITLNWNDKAKVIMDSSGIKINWDDKAKVELTDSSLLADWNGTSKVTLDDSMAKTESSGHSVTVDASGVHLA